MKICSCESGSDFFSYLLDGDVVQGEHKDTPLFQVVIKSKLTGIFL